MKVSLVCLFLLAAVKHAVAETNVGKGFGHVPRPSSYNPPSYSPPTSSDAYSDTTAGNGKQKPLTKLPSLMTAGMTQEQKEALYQRLLASGKLTAVADQETVTNSSPTSSNDRQPSVGAPSSNTVENNVQADPMKWAVMTAGMNEQQKQALLTRMSSGQVGTPSSATTVQDGRFAYNRPMSLNNKPSVSAPPGKTGGTQVLLTSVKLPALLAAGLSEEQKQALLQQLIASGKMQMPADAVLVDAESVMTNGQYDPDKAIVNQLDMADVKFTKPQTEKAKNIQTRTMIVDEPEPTYMPGQDNNQDFFKLGLPMERQGN